MNARRGSHARLCLGVWLLAGAPACSAERPAPGPSLLLVTVDTLRRDHVGAYGGAADLTPQLDALAREGLVHEAAFTTIPTTAPATASLFTGLYPHEHGVRRNGAPLPETQRPAELAARLRDAGYATAAFVTTPLLAPGVTGFRGFEVYDPPRELLRSGSDACDAALRWLSVGRRRPVFLWVHLYDPHAPYGDIDDKRRALPVDPHTYGFVDKRRYASGEQRARMAELYANGVRAADAALGRLVGGVRHELRDPLIVVVADHGEALDEHLESRGYAYDHGEFLDEDAIRIPLVVAGPGVSPGRSRGVASIRDLYTTLLSAAAVGDPEARHAGRRDLRRPVEAHRVARVERRWLDRKERLPLGPVHWERVRSHAVAVSDGRRQLILGDDGAPSTRSLSAGTELVEAAREHLAAVGETAGPPGAIDVELRRALRSLGYAQ